MNEVTDMFLRMMGVYTEDLKTTHSLEVGTSREQYVVMKLLLNILYMYSTQNTPLCILFRATNKMHYKLLYGKQSFF